MPSWDTTGDFDAETSSDGFVHNAIGGNTDDGALRVGYPFGSLTRGLVAYYPFEGDATDLTSQGNDGTVNGATYANGGGPGSFNAYEFDGVDDYIDCGDLLSGRSAFTLALFVRWDHFMGGGSNPGVALQGDDWYNHAGIFESGGDSEVFFRVRGSGTDGVVTTPIPSENEWNHYAITFADSTVKGWENGSYLGSDQAPSTTSNFSDGLDIGRLAWQSFEFDGKLADVRVYDRALSSGELSALAALTEPSTVTTENIQ